MDYYAGQVASGETLAGVQPLLMRSISMRLFMLIVASSALMVAACAGPSVLVAGESARSPEPGPPTFPVRVVAGDDLTPLAADITVAQMDLATTGAGTATVIWQEEWTGEVIPLTVSSAGFETQTVELAEIPDDEVEMRMEPVVLEGTVSTEDGRPLPDTAIELGGRELVTDEAGEYRINRAVAGDMTARRPAWETAVVPYDGTSTQLDIVMDPLIVRALRVQADKAGESEAWRRLLRLSENTDINGMVVDLKDEAGVVVYDTGIALAHDIGAVQPAYDITSIVADMDEHGLYKIARIVAFQDPYLASEQPGLATIDSKTGRPWETKSGRAWLDPTDPAAWEYPLSLAEEACRLGFDEVQFDYVQFPVGGVATARFDELVYDDAYYEDEAQFLRIETIGAFLQEAHDRLYPAGCALAADILAITLESRSDEGIGQQPGPLSSAVDVLSPMIYSYAYAPGWRDYEDPNEHAPEIVQTALDTGIPRLEGPAIYRPWLQRAKLEPPEIRAVWGIAEERSLGWMLWSENSSFGPNMLPPVR